VAHVLEHMMFKGTRTLGPEEFSRVVAEAGGRENAFTSTDYTAYHQQVHRDRLPLMMRLEADRMVNLAIRPQEFAREIKVVMEERRWRYEDQPRWLLHETLLATAFSAHPYKWPVIGWMEDLQSMNWRDAQSWYRQWYAPNNAVVVVVGDVEPEKVVALARQHYGALARKTIPMRKDFAEPVQRGMKRVIVKAPAELPYVRLAYKAPALRDPANEWEPYALSLLAELLGGGDAARLQDARSRKAPGDPVGAEYDMISRGPGMMFLYAAAAHRKERRRARDQPAGDGRAHREGRRVRRGARARQSAGDRADGLQARLVLRAGSRDRHARDQRPLVRDAERIPQRLRAISAEQVRIVASSTWSTTD
jgi:zinc protease